MTFHHLLGIKVEAIPEDSYPSFIRTSTSTLHHDSLLLLSTNEMTRNIQTTTSSSNKNLRKKEQSSSSIPNTSNNNTNKKKDENEKNSNTNNQIITTTPPPSPPSPPSSPSSSSWTSTTYEDESNYFTLSLSTLLSIESSSVSVMNTHNSIKTESIINGHEMKLIHDIISSLSDIICQYTNFSVLVPSLLMKDDYMFEYSEYDTSRKDYCHYMNTSNNENGSSGHFGDDDDDDQSNGTSTGNSNKKNVIMIILPVGNNNQHGQYSVLDNIQVQDYHVYYDTGNNNNKQDKDKDQLLSSEKYLLNWIQWDVYYEIVSQHNDYNNNIRNDTTMNQSSNYYTPIQIQSIMNMALSNNDHYNLNNILMEKNEGVLSVTGNGWEVEKSMEYMETYSDHNPNKANKPNTKLIENDNNDIATILHPIRITGMIMMIVFITTMIHLIQTGSKRHRLFWEKMRRNGNFVHYHDDLEATCEGTTYHKVIEIAQCQGIEDLLHYSKIIQADGKFSKDNYISRNSHQSSATSSDDHDSGGLLLEDVDTEEIKIKSFSSSSKNTKQKKTLTNCTELNTNKKQNKSIDAIETNNINKSSSSLYQTTCKNKIKKKANHNKKCSFSPLLGPLNDNQPTKTFSESPCYTNDNCESITTYRWKGKSITSYGSRLKSGSVKARMLKSFLSDDLHNKNSR